MSVLTIVPNRNQKLRDYTGGFLPWSDLWMQEHGGERIKVDIDAFRWRRRRHQLQEIGRVQPNVIAFFTHGLKRSLPQMGWAKWSAHYLADEIAEHSNSPRIVLYACSTGDGPGVGGDGGFADRLRDRLCEAGAIYCQVDSHTTAGRADSNPYVRRFLGHGLGHAQKGGEWLVAPGSIYWNRWRKLLQGKFRWEFPFLTSEQILERLRAEH